MRNGAARWSKSGRVGWLWCARTYLLRRRTFIVEIDGRRAGYLTLEAEDDASCEVSVALDEPFRRSGYGVAVVCHAVALAGNAGFGWVVADVFRENEASRKVFLKAGFTAIGDVDGAIERFRIACG